MTLLDDLIKADSPNLFWPMQETSGSTVNDVSGNARHGTNSGCVVAQPGFGAQQYSYHIDAQGDYVTVAQDAGITLATNFTMGCWFKSTQATAGSGLMFLGQAHSSHVSPYYRNLPTLYSATPAYSFAPGGSFISENFVPDLGYTTAFKDIWRFLAVSYGDRYARFYLDGTLNRVYDYGSTASLSSSTAPFRIGMANPNLASSYGWTGYASHVFLTPSVLSDERIATYWRASKGERITVSSTLPTFRQKVLATSPAHYWPMDEGTGTPTEIVAGLTTTLNGSLAWADRGPFAGDKSIDFTNNNANYLSFTAVTDTTPVSWAVAFQPDDLADNMLITANAASGYLYITNSTTTRVQTTSGSYVDIVHTAKPYVANGNWYLLHLVRTSATAWSLYINGDYAGTGTTDSASFSVAAIGRYQPTGGFDHDGRMGHVAHWTRALTATEISDMHSVWKSCRGGTDLYGRSTVNDPAIAAYYPLAEGSGAFAMDAANKAGDGGITASNVTYSGSGPSPELQKSLAFRTTSLVTLPATFDDALTSTSMPQSWEIWAECWTQVVPATTYVPLIATQNSAWPLMIGNISGTWADEVITTQSGAGSGLTMWRGANFVIQPGWHHYVVTFNGTTHTGWNCYMDGINVEQMGLYKDLATGGATGFASSQGYTYSLNGYNSGARGCAVRGFALYTRELRAADVMERYKLGLGGKTGIVGY